MEQDAAISQGAGGAASQMLPPASRLLEEGVTSG